MKIPAAQAAVDKEWENSEKIPAWDLTKVRSKKEEIDEARTSGTTVHFASLMDICHLKNAELETKHQRYKGRVVLRGDIVKDNSGSYAVFTEQGSSASQVTAAKSHGYHIQIAWLRWTSSGRSICLYTGKNGRCSQIIENSHIGMSRRLHSSTTTQMAKIIVRYGRSSRSSWAESVWSSFGRTVMGKAFWENPIEGRLGEDFQLGMCLRTTWKRIILICVCGRQKLAGKQTKTLIRCGKYSTKKLIWENQHLSWIMCTWDVLKDNVKWAKILWTITEPCLNHEFPRCRTEKLPCSGNLCISSWSYDMEGHAKKCVERYCELANRTTQQLHKISTPCVDDHHFKEEEMKSVEELSQVCSQNVLKCFYLARIGRLDILWSVNKLARSSHMWIQTALPCG